MSKTWIKNALIINEGRKYIGSVLIHQDKIQAVYEGECPQEAEVNGDKVIDATGKWLIPGCIDDQVHFREPGLLSASWMEISFCPKAAVMLLKRRLGQRHRTERQFPVK